MDVYAVLLMAGNSVRFGGNKLLHQADNKSIYEYALELIQRQRGLFSDIIAVTKYDTIYRTLYENRIRAVWNPHSERGISSSIQLGLEAIPPAPQNAYLFLVADQPFLTDTTLKGLVCGWKESKKGLGCVAWNERLGNPAIFSENYREQLMELKGDTGGKSIIRKNREDLYLYQTAVKKELEDLDREEELKKHFKS